MAANLIDRWREWGLSSAEIERLTRADQRSEALERRLRMRGKAFFSRGKRGVVSTAEVLLPATWPLRADDDDVAPERPAPVGCGSSAGAAAAGEEAAGEGSGGE